MATRKKIPLIDASADLAVTGTVEIAGSGSAVITFPSTTSTLETTIGSQAKADAKVEDSITDGHTTVAPSGNAVFDALALKMANPMTTQGDTIYGGASGTPTRLPKGTAGQVLTMNSGATAPEWASNSSITSSNSLMIKPSVLTNTISSFNPYQINSNTTASLFRFNIDSQITVNHLTFRVATVTTTGTFKIGIYSSDGSTKLLDHTTASFSSANYYTENLASSVTLSPGEYYVVFIPISTTDLTILSYTQIGTYGPAFNNVLANHPIYVGTNTVTAGTLPTSFDVTAITATTSYACPIMRLDN